MKLPLSRKIASQLLVLDEVESTNGFLVAIAPREKDFTVVVSNNQTAGRGRLGRAWFAPAGQSLAISVLLRPVSTAGVALPVEFFGWLPLIAGASMARAIDPCVPGLVGLKWPNDVQIDGLKVSGLLGELVLSGESAVIGAGVNLSLQEDELPTAVSTSLTLSGTSLGGDELADYILSRYLRELRSLYAVFLRYGGDANASGIHTAVTELCTTIGQKVRVEMPGGRELFGVASGIDRSGRLEICQSIDRNTVSIAAGDITHLRSVGDAR